jgi:hypothetical protein
MAMPRRWAVVLACLAIVAVFVERAGVLYRAPPPAKVAAEVSAPACPSAPAATTEVQPAELPSVTQPGGIDPLGATRAIHDALKDCPEPSAIR